MEATDNVQVVNDNDTRITKTVSYYGLTQDGFDEKYGRLPENTDGCLSRAKKKCQCSKQCVQNTLLRRLPVINMILRYRVKEYMLRDLVSGLSVGVMTVPQSMGYALLAQVPLIIGLYTSFFPVIINCVFGSSPHVATGMSALNCLIIGSAVQRGISSLDPGGNDTELTQELDTQRVAIAVSVTFLSGIILLAMSALKMSFIVSYIGEQFMDGFLTAAFVIIVTRQVKLILGISVISRPGYLNLVYLIIGIFQNIAQTNLGSVICSAISIALLLIVKCVVNKRFKSKLPVPIPIDLLLVIVSTLASHYGNFSENFGIKVVGEIPKGVPRPSVPQPKHMAEYIPDGIALALISYLHVYMMASLFSKRHSYPCDPDQELFACGMTNTFGSFFACISSTSSPPRSFVLEATGGKTQIANFVSAVIILVFMLALAPLLQDLPVCVLASIILVALLPLLNNGRMCLVYWKTNKYDLSIWFVTAFSTMLLTVEVGMVLGLLFSCVVAVYKSQRAYSALLAPNDHGILVDTSKYAHHCRNIHGLKIFSYDGPLQFATKDVFKAKLFSAISSPRQTEELRIKTVSEFTANANDYKVASTNANSDKSEMLIPMKPPKSTDEVSKPDPKDEEHGACSPDTPLTSRRRGSKDSVSTTDSLHTIIVDCTRIAFADTVGAKCLASLHDDYRKVGVQLLLAGCSEDVKAQLGRVSQCKDLIARCLFPSVHDAILHTQCGLSSKGVNIEQV